MNEDIFTGKADIYARYRPAYSQQALELLRGEICSEDVIADFGAGTGIFTRQLLGLGCRVVAVEPNGDMLRKLRENVPQAEIVNAPAENSGIAEHSVKLVTAATAFHWFEPQRFRAECVRILKDNGKVMLLWNNVDESSPLISELNDINRRYCGIFAVRSGKYNSDSTRCFFREYREYCFDNPLTFDKSGFVGNRLSRSYSPKPGDANYAPLREALEQFFNSHSENGSITLPNFTECFFGLL